MEKSGLLKQNAFWMFRSIRFIAGSLTILILLSVYCLNVSHHWKEGVGALPNQHVSWLPASAFRSGSIESLGLAAVFLVVGGLAMNLRRRQVYFLLSGVTAIAAVTSLVVIGQRLSPRPFPIFDLTGFFPYENHFAAFANLLIPVALCMGERWRIRAFHAGKVSSPAALFFCAAGLMVAAVALSGSRAGLLITGLMVGGWVLLKIRLYSRHPEIKLLHPRRIAQGSIVVAVFVFICALTYLGNHAHQIGNEFSFRGKILKDTVAMWKDNPFWGSGPGSFAAVFPYYQSLPVEEYFFRHAHCEPLQFLAEYGLLGCLILIAGIALIFFSSQKTSIESIGDPYFRELEARGLWLALAGVGLHGLVDFPLRHSLIALLTVVWVAILASSIRSGNGRAYE